MKVSVKEIKERLRLELEGLFSNFPDDSDLVEYEEATTDRDEKALLLRDVLEVVLQLRRHYTAEEVESILGKQGGLKVLLSKSYHRMGFMNQRFIQ